MPAIRVGAERLAGLVDQAIFSLVGLVQTAVLARALSPDLFGVYAMAMSFVLVCHAVHWGLVVMPMTVSSAQQSELPLRSWMKWHVVVTLGLLLLCAVVASLTNTWRSAADVSKASALAAIVLPGYLSYEHFRRQFFLTGQSAKMPRIAVVWGLFQLGCLAVVVMLFPTPSAAALGVAAASFAAALVAAVAGWPRAGKLDASLGELLRQRTAAIAGNTAAVLPYMGYNTAMPIVVGQISGPGAAGVFSATRLFLAPMNTVAAAIGSVDKPRAAQALRTGGAEGLTQQLWRTARVMAMFAVPYAIVVAFTTEHLVAWVLGAQFAAYGDLVRLWVVIGVIMSVGHPLETGLIVLDQAHLLFWSRMLALVVAVAVLALVPGQGAAVAVAAVLMAWIASAALGALQLSRHIRKLAPPPNAG